MKKIQHKAIASVLKLYQTKNEKGATQYNVLMPYYQNQSLKEQQSFLKDNESFDNKWLIIYGIAHAMKYAHKNDVFHLNLKPSNILLDESYYHKIDGFGSPYLPHESIMSVPIDTLQFMAPEIKNGQPYNEKADIYSYGLLIYYIYSGIHPYHEILGQSVDIVRQNLLNTQKDLNLKIDNFHELHDGILKILKRCLNPIPSERPTFKKICSKLMKIVLMKPSSMLNNCNMKINSHYSNLETFFNQLKVIIDLPDSYEQSMNFDFSLDSLIQIIQPYQHHYIGLIFLCGAHQQGSHQ